MVLRGRFRAIAQARKQFNVRQNLNTVFPTKSENDAVMEVAVQSAQTLRYAQPTLSAVLDHLLGRQERPFVEPEG